MNREVLEYYAERFNKQEGRKYPCSNQIVLCRIITNDRNKALDFMKDKEFAERRERYNQIDWVLTNGERWQWRNWNSSNIRGYRFYKVVIDENISEEIFTSLVLPACASYCCSMEII